MPLTWWVVGTDRDGVKPIAQICRSYRVAINLKDEIEHCGGSASVELEDEAWDGADAKAVLEAASLINR